MSEPRLSHTSALLPSVGILLGTLFVTASCGDEGPTGPDTSGLEILVVQGDHQASGPGTPLPVPLKVRVQKSGNGAPVEGVRIRWKILIGLGALVDPPNPKTDSLGLAEAWFTLGPEVGLYTVEASIEGAGSKAVEFSAEAILAPSLSVVPPGPVEGGDTLLLAGSNFSPDPSQNVVTFSKVRGRVVSSSTSELQVVVPNCLLPRQYEVRVQVGALATPPVELVVSGAPVTLLLEPGEDRVMDASEGFGCFHLPFESGSLFLVMPHSTSTVGGSSHGYSLIGLTGDGVHPSLHPLLPPPAGAVRAVPSPSRGDLQGSRFERSLDARDRWHERLRRKEAAVWAEWREQAWGEGASDPLAPGPRPLPEVGDKRVFTVLNTEDKFDRITARLRHVSGHSLIYVDEAAPDGGFRNEDLAALTLEFEDPIYPTVTGIFGSESDLDQNERVIILLTPAVNRLTPPGSDGYVGGFFYGLDLLTGRSGSNEGEVFYAMVPDPSGEEGPVISRYTALATIPSVLAHEFQHMVHFNQRMLLGGAESTESLWLSEALAQMAEDLVGEAFEMASQHTKARQYRTGNWHRAVRFMQDPGRVSLLASLPPGTLAERGAGWLFLKQVYGRFRPGNILAALSRSTLTGVGNVSAVTGLEWKELVSDWAGSLYLDGTGVPVRPGLQVAGVDLRISLSEGIGSYPLDVNPFGDSSASISGTLWPSAPNYYLVHPSVAGGIVLAAGGSGGGLPEAPLGLQVLVVRLL